MLHGTGRSPGSFAWDASAEPHSPERMRSRRPRGPPERRLGWSLPPTCASSPPLPPQVPRAPFWPVALKPAGKAYLLKYKQWTCIGRHLCDRGPANVGKSLSAQQHAHRQRLCVAGRTRPAASGPSPLPTALHACAGLLSCTMWPAEVQCYRWISAVSEWERSGVAGGGGGLEEERGVQMKRNKQMMGHTAAGWLPHTLCCACCAAARRPDGRQQVS